MADKTKKNPWHSKAREKTGANSKTKSETAVTTPKPMAAPKDTNTRFQEASAKMQASVQRHIQEYESSSEEEDLEDGKILDSVMVNYTTSSKNADLGRTKEFLEQSFHSGAVICLVCIASVKRTQAIWSCESCYTAFHLLCIQRWAKDTIYQQAQNMEPGLGELPIRDKSFKKLQWCCPKCRSPYSEADVPNKYQCFCKKTYDPVFHPWAVPHSCGDICNKPLLPNCGHQCLLLCHPGPCPPCPKMVSLPCSCRQSQPTPVRCSVSSWCCTQVCNKSLDCGQHRCTKKCHTGECDPCSKFKEQACQCKSRKDKIPCSQTSWQCTKVCGKRLACGYHTCEQVCHTITCGQCPFTGFQKCPCGAVQKEVTCPTDVSSCGGSCNKVLPCGKHICPHKCHKDKCPQCLELVDKKCRCEMHTKQLPCSKQYLCETKCKNVKECGRHPCNKKCCNGDCLPCDKVCGRSLQCGKHKCISICHRGPCYPCPQMAKVPCRCGRTFYSVPCGRQKKAKPPKCSHNCRIPTPCSHIKENTHKCHFGSCPQCKEKCGKLLYCGHSCVAVCHSCVPVVLSTAKADTPCELQQPKVEVRALPCPPCKKPVQRSCLGDHEITDWPCHSARVSSCGRKCGRPLACTNHKCFKECHPVADGQSTQIATDCEKCEDQCKLSRPSGCTHPCKKRCHPAPCELCQQFLKRSCHCGLTELFLQCNLFTATDAAQKEKSLSCQQQCIRLLDCGHRCRSTCHSGGCPNEEMCTRKSRVYCPCRRIKKDVACHLVQDNTLSCDEGCELKKAEDFQAQQEEESKRLLEEQIKNNREIAEFEKKFGKKKYKQRKTVENEEDITILAKYRIFIVSGTAVLVSILLYVLLK